jgi:hypothetical protein
MEEEFILLDDEPVPSVDEINEIKESGGIGVHFETEDGAIFLDEMTDDSIYALAKSVSEKNKILKCIYILYNE